MPSTSSTTPRRAWPISTWNRRAGLSPRGALACALKGQTTSGGSLIRLVATLRPPVERAPAPGSGWARLSPLQRRVSVHIASFEACAGFTAKKDHNEHSWRAARPKAVLHGRRVISSSCRQRDQGVAPLADGRSGSPRGLSRATDSAPYLPFTSLSTAGSPWKVWRQRGGQEPVQSSRQRRGQRLFRDERLAGGR